MKFRDDIQALRGWAVGLVLLDHVRIGPFGQGWLGVDIFFVISGFLITGIIARGLQSGDFSFAQFYFRRAKRLLPAAYVTVLLTSVGAVWFLTSLEMKDLTSQVFGALTWTINFVLYYQTDYFANSAEFKPLLHMWSLAVEEQFYLIVPALLFFTPQRFWKAVFAAVLIASLVLCIYWTRANPPAAFYMLPSRAWELAIGGLGALMLDRWAMAARIAFWPALVALIAVPIWSTGYPHPGLDALIVCVATLVVILAKSETFGRATAAVGLTKLGDVSYSLYLVHWPVMAFINNAFIGPVPIQARAIGLALSVVLAWLLYVSIERPIHRSERVRLSPRVVSFFACATVAIAALQVGLGRSSSNSFAFLRRPNVGLSETCAKDPLTNPECRTGEHPKVLVWGDSYAMALVSGVVENTKLPVAQATLSACPPIKGMAIHRPERESPSDWAKFCIGFNENVLNALSSSEEITTVVLASPWRSYDKVDVWTGTAENPSQQKTSVPRAIEGLKHTVQILRDYGKKVIVVGPPPTTSDRTDTSACIERLFLGKITMGNNCSTDKALTVGGNVQPTEFLSALKGMDGVSTVSLYDVMCDEQSCLAQVDGLPLYRDGGHLSYEGSRIVVGRSELPLLLH